MVKVPLRCVFEDFGSHTGEKKDVSEICLGSTWQKRLCHQFLGGFSRSECVCAIFAGSRTPPSTDGNPPRNWGLNCAIYFGNSVYIYIYIYSLYFIVSSSESQMDSSTCTYMFVISINSLVAALHLSSSIFGGMIFDRKIVQAVLLSVFHPALLYQVIVKGLM